MWVGFEIVCARLSERLEDNVVLREIIARARHGDEAAFATLYQHYHQFILGCFLGNGFSAETSWDLVQETFLQAYRGLRTLNLGQDVRFGGWLAVIARNVARKHARRVVCDEVRIDDESYPEPADPSAIPPPAAPEQAEDYDALMECLAALDAEQRAIVVSYYLLGRPFRNIAQTFSLSDGTVRNRMSAALEALLACLQQKDVLS